MATPTGSKIAISGKVLAFDAFWRWLQAHPNCLVSAGTPDIVLYDYDDFHWNLSSEPAGSFMVQVMRGKQPVGEMVIDPTGITYVQLEEKGEEEYVFDCIEEGPEGAEVIYSFTMSHGYDPEETPAKGRWVH